MSQTDSTRKILVTGSDGLIGWHLRAFLFTQPDVEIIQCNRRQFNDDDYLSSAILQADAIVHLAGMNRGDEEEIYQTNIALAQRIADHCRKLQSRPHIVFSSSTHADGDTKYGQSKRNAGIVLEKWANEEEARFCNLVLPHVFGEHGKPFYNSVVSTFAYQVATGEEPTIDRDGQLNLLHCQDVAETIWTIIEDGVVGDHRPEGQPLKVSELLDRLLTMAERYRDGVVPNLDDSLNHRLFNTLRSYTPHDQRPRKLTLHADDRGHLFEAIRADGQGQVFLSTTHPGITRGNHFHFGKVERFLVISGRAKIRLRKVLTDEVHVYDVGGDCLQAIDIPTLHTHNITNVGDEPLITLFWAGEHFDPENSDTYYLTVDEMSDLTSFDPATVN
jgi:UDP-2-acetamido-2,6-beta-L-arabino-hexul-4-ose reductase